MPTKDSTPKAEYSKVGRSCRECGKEYLIYHCTAIVGQGVFCSRRCYRKWQKRLTIDQLENRFWMKVSKSDECWNWIGAIFRFGYGVFRVDGKNERAHRRAWILTYGIIPKGKWVLHRCDNPTCVNPSHLYLGDCQDNANDRKSRDRNNYAYGGRCAQAKLTGVVSKIKSELIAGIGDGVLARKYGVESETIRAIRTGRTWKHVPWPQLNE